MEQKSTISVLKTEVAALQEERGKEANGPSDSFTSDGPRQRAHAHTEKRKTKAASKALLLSQQ